MEDDIFADNLAKRTLVKEEVGKHIEVVERIISLVSPIECELISAIWIIGKIAGIDTVRNYKYLNVVKQSVLYVGTVYQHKLLCRLSVTEASPYALQTLYHMWAYFSMAFEQKTEGFEKVTNGKSIERLIEF